MASSVSLSTGSSQERRPPAVPALATMLDALSVFAILVHDDGRIVQGNAAVARAGGWPGGHCPVQHLNELLPAPEAARLLAPTAAEATPVHALFHPASGPPLVVAWSARPLPAASGEPLLCLTGCDITRETQLEHHLVQNQWFETAAAISGGMAHDFNNVLAAILGLSEIIALRLPPDSALREFAAKIGISIDRAKILVRRFSQFSRKTAGPEEALPTAMVVEELTKLMRGFLPGSVTFAVEITPETPWCAADRHVLEQIILNCANFLRARLRQDNGAIKLSCAAGAAGQPRIELSGSGQGLLGLDLDGSFALDLKPTATAYESGIGLFAARALAEQQGAKLRLIRRDPRTVAFVLDLAPAR